MLLFQPHRFTRTRDLFGDFVEVLSQADRSLLLDVYAAGEPAIPGADSVALCTALRERGADVQHLPDALQQPQQILAHLPSDAVLLCMGAGSIAQLASQWQAIFATEARS